MMKDAALSCKGKCDGEPRCCSAELHTLLRPFPAEEMTAVPVERYVSNPRNEGPRCLVS